MTDLVIAALVAGPLEAGVPGFIGVQYDIKPGWHIYWENPGESGIPTEVTLELPPGMAASAPQYPGPHSFSVPGDLINYGYEGSMTLLVPVSLDGVAAGTVTAATRWLVCRDEQCVPGRAELTLKLPAPSTLDVAAVQGHVPAPLPSSASVVRDGRGASVTIPGAEVAEVFANLALEESLLQTAASGERARIWLKEAPAEGSAAVLRVTEGGAERFYLLPL
jgi:DsbC/DsbD-like thiol-disulfide interchange protein